MVTSQEILEINPLTGLKSFFQGKPPKLWGLGNPAILDCRLLGIISARQIDSDLALKSSQLLKQLAFLKEVSFIGGWHSPLEAEALRILSVQPVPIVFCVPKGLNQFAPPVEVKNRINRGQALLLTHCSPKAKRISRDASIRRNELVVESAETLLVLSAPAGSASLKLARSAVRQGKPVFTLDHRLNKELLASGASPATLEKIEEALP
jgi:predicted Rossmann fold nucleotide-binding protein DprA/Smf involved in DNA uptake